tara:strand:- start:637 stop:2031 length:1395 start_codon:yes stop_codon:yes gene_type:complete
MSVPNIVNVEKFEILPSNQPANNTYSFHEGNPIITITIPSQAKYLRPQSLRINGTLRINNSDRTICNNNACSSLAQSDIRLNSRVGVHSVFQNVVLSSEATNQSLEAIRQYGRMVSCILSSTHSEQDLMSEKSNVAVMNGLDDASGNLVNNEVRFSIPLYCGMLQSGESIPLSQNGINGLNIQLELASDQQVLKGSTAFPQQNVAGTPLGVSAQSGSFYQLKDISVSGDLLVPDDAGQQKLSVSGSGQFQYNSYSSLYSVINSNDSTQTYNLSSSQVLSVFHTFLPVSFSNNYNEDAFENGELLNTNGAGTVYDSPTILKKVSFSRGGVKLGLDYEIDCENNSLEGLPESQVMMNYLNAFQDFSASSRMINNRQLLGYGGKELKPYNDVMTKERAVGIDNDVKRNFGIGLAMDRVSDVGMSFKGQSYATRIVSNLDGKSPNAVFTFVLSKNTLQYSPNGIMISS